MRMRKFDRWQFSLVPKFFGIHKIPINPNSFSFEDSDRAKIFARRDGSENGAN